MKRWIHASSNTNRLTYNQIKEIIPLERQCANFIAQNIREVELPNGGKLAVIIAKGLSQVWMMWYPDGPTWPDDREASSENEAYVTATLLPEIIDEAESLYPELEIQLDADTDSILISFV